MSYSHHNVVYKRKKSHLQKLLASKIFEHPRTRSARHHRIAKNKPKLKGPFDVRCRVPTQVAQARYMSSSMWTFALLRDSSDLHIYKDLYGERNKLEKKRKITVELQ